MDKLVRKIEVPLGIKAIEKAGLYIVQKKDLDRLAEVAADAYQDYPLHNWFTKGKYDAKASKLIMQISLKTMTEDAVIYADSEEINGFAVWLPFGFTGSKTLPFLMNGGLSLIFHSGFGIIGRLLTYETYAMNLKKEFTENYDWYLYNLSIKKDAQGKGIASKLMRPMLQFCDDERMVAYLETNKESNVGLYRHYGFDLMKEEQIPKSTVTHYAMVRKPKEQKWKKRVNIKPSSNKTEANKMQNEKKELLKKFKTVIDDLMDHYEEYTDEEKAQIKEIFQKVAELNTILDKYDIEAKFDWNEYFTLVGQCFDSTPYIF